MARERERLHIRIGLGFLADPSLSPAAKVLYEMIRFRADGNEEINTSMRQLARQTGMTMDVASRAARDLVASGDITLTPSRGGAGGGGTVIRILSQLTAPIPGLFTDSPRTEACLENPTRRDRKTQHGVYGKANTANPGNPTRNGKNPTRSSIRSSIPRVRASELTEDVKDDVDVEALRERLRERRVSDLDIDNAFRLNTPRIIEVAEANADHLESTQALRKSWRAAFIAALRERWLLPEGALTYTERQARHAAAQLRAAERAAEARAAEEYSAQVQAWIDRLPPARLMELFAGLPPDQRKQFGTPCHPRFHAALYERHRRDERLNDNCTDQNAAMATSSAV